MTHSRGEPGPQGSGVRVSNKHQTAIFRSRFGAVFTCVEYRVRPVNANPPTMLPRTVGISFQMK